MWRFTNFTFVYTEITERVKKVMFLGQLSASEFADKIGVPRSTISHLLKGRNKPSLDFVMKLLEAFPKVDLYWLLYNKGEAPTEDEILEQQLPKGGNQPMLPFAEPILKQKVKADKSAIPPEEVLPEKKVMEAIKVDQTSNQLAKREITKVILWYSDGSFEVSER